jgi:hypothetical protein
MGVVTRMVAPADPRSALPALPVGALLWLAWRRPAGRRLLALGAGALVAHAAARLLAPHLFLPDRYVTYSVPVLVALALPAAARAAGTLAARAFTGARPAAGRGAGDQERGIARGAWVGAALGAGLLALAGGRVSADAGWGVHVSPSDGIYRAVAALPVDAVVAGWPAGPIDSIPYLARRRVLLAFETHQAFHRAYAEEMRRRAGALFAAYFAATWAPVLRLRDEFGVTHLLLDRRHLSGPAPPGYFAPFDAWIAADWARGRREGFVLARAPRDAIRFTEGTLTLLDLRACCPEHNATAADRSRASLPSRRPRPAPR